MTPVSAGKKKGHRKPQVKFLIFHEHDYIHTHKHLCQSSTCIFNTFIGRQTPTKNVTTNFLQPFQPLFLKVFVVFFTSFFTVGDFWRFTAEAAVIPRKKNSFWRSQSWPILILLINCDWRNLKSALLYFDASCAGCLFVNILTAVEKFEKSQKEKKNLK